MDVVELEVLARGHVRDAVGILFSHLRHGFQLHGVHSACWNLDALHAGSVPHRHRTLGQIARRIGHGLDVFSIVPLTVVVALAIGASSKPRFGEQALVHFALLAQRHVSFKTVNLVRQPFRYLSGKSVFPK